jgi:hypothetical protein
MGKATIHQCPQCSNEIQGQYMTVQGSFGLPTTGKFQRIASIAARPFRGPRRRFTLPKAMADELTGLSDAERIMLKASIDDIAVDLPMTHVAVTRFKKLLPKMGELAPAMRKLVVDVAGKMRAELLTKGGG